MLGKLLKYDFKALSRVMFPLQGGTLLAVLIGVILVRLTVDSIISSTSYYSPYSSAVAYDGLFFGITSMLAALFGAVIFASSWVTLFFIGRHFFQSFLRDEGYLSFTLPVTTTQNLLSKTIAGATWILVNGAILLIGMLLLFVMGIPGNEPGLINTEILKYGCY